MLLVEISTNVLIIIFALNFLKSNRPIPAAMVDVEDMAGVVMTMIGEMVITEEAEMVPESIATVLATVNLFWIENIFILLMKLQSLIFLVQPESFAKSLPDMLGARLGSIIFASSTAPTVNYKGKQASDENPDDTQ